MKHRRFRCTRQHNAMQCGIACLAMICEYFGKKYSLNYLESFCQPDREGISMLGLSEGAISLGLESITFKATINDLYKLSSPCILHWNQNHFVVLYKISKNKFYISDPSKGLVRYNFTEFRKYWISSQNGESEFGVLMQLIPTDSFYKSPNNIESSRTSFNVLWSQLSKYKKLFFQVILGLCLSCLLQLIMPFLTQSIVDKGIKKDDIGFIWLVLLGEFMIVIGRTLTDIIRRWLLLHISMRVNISLVSAFFIKLLKLPMSFFETKLLGDLLQRIGDHSRVQNFLTGQALSIVFTVLSFIVFGIVLLIYNSFIFFIFLLGSMIYCGWISIFLRRRKVLDFELFECQATNQNRTYEFLTSMQEIKLQDCEKRRRWEWEDTQAELFSVQMKTLKLQQAQQAGSVFINEIKNILITAFSATAVINGHISLGAMLAIQYMVGQLNSPVEQFMQFCFNFQDVKISLERINDIYSNKNEDSEESQLKQFSSNKSIAFTNVDFKYNLHALRKTLDGVTFQIPDKKITAIVGASGSGKTTLIKLMLGYYRTLNGSILISGHNISEYNLRWWRRQCGVVMQDGVIFSETIERNIAVDDNVVDNNRLQIASSVANIHEYIMSLPLKYSTKIGRDGVQLSQGQKQRILIARAVYKNPDFIFLDEATNSLDAKNERAIVENLNKFYQGRTVIVVAHRLSTVKNADQIIVLDGGKIAETGTHNSLISRKGTYFNLVKNQLELGA